MNLQPVYEILAALTWHVYVHPEEFVKRWSRVECEDPQIPMSYVIRFIREAVPRSTSPRYLSGAARSIKPLPTLSTTRRCHTWLPATQTRGQSGIGTACHRQRKSSCRNSSMLEVVLLSDTTLCADGMPQGQETRHCTNRCDEGS